MKKFSFLLGVLIFFYRQAEAHPHAFIEMKNTPIIEENQLTGFSMQWLLDEPSSAEVLYDLQLAEGDKQQQQKLADEVMKNVIAEHYFSYLFDKQGNKIKYSAKPANYGMKAVNHQVMYYFDFRLATPIELRNTELTLQTYDPSYYVSMYYDPPKSTVNFSALPSQCEGRLLDPNIDDKVRQYASSLDKTQKDEDFTLGKQFAQQVVILCK